MRRRFRAAEIDATKPFGWSDVIRAWAGGDLLSERIRLTKAQADREETAAALDRRDVIPWQEVVSFINRTFSPVREQSLAMPTVMAARVNPADPEHAKAHLTDWVDGFLKHCREQIPAGPEKEVDGV